LVHSALSEVDALWVLDERQRLGQVYVSSLEELAHLYLDVNLLEHCLAICQLALAHEPYREVIYQLEMQAYAALGDRVSIVRRYRACKAALQEGLGISPSQETENIHRELTL
jgi:DNA-binding SARP family transcriptional activator